MMIMRENHTRQYRTKSTIKRSDSHPYTLTSRLRSSYYRRCRAYFRCCFRCRRCNLALLLELELSSERLQSSELSSWSLAMFLATRVVKLSRLYSSSSSIILSKELKVLYSPWLRTHLLRWSFMKSACDFSLDSYMQLARSSKLNRPMEQRKRSVSPSAYTSSLNGSKYLSLGCLMNLRNSGELYSTVVRSTEGLSAGFTSTASQKSQSRQL